MTGARPMARRAAHLALASLLFATALLAVDRAIAGLILCSDLGILPW